MNAIVKECGALLKRLEEQRQAAKRQPDEEKKIYAAMITEYQDVMLRMEQSFLERDISGNTKSQICGCGRLRRDCSH